MELTGFNFKCKDAGIMDCDFEVKGSSSRDEIMQIAAIHAKQTHKMETVSPDLANKVSVAIKS